MDPGAGWVLVRPERTQPLPAPPFALPDLQRLARVVMTWLQAWAYTAAEPGARRDLRIDLLRGFCVFAMLADHLGGESWLYAITGGNGRFVSAAEGFVFISGLVMGQVYASKIKRLGLKHAIGQALLRARTLYVITTVMTLIFALTRLYTDLAMWVPRSVSPGAESLPEVIVGTLTLHFTYHGTDILALYVFCVLGSVAGLTALAFGKWRWVLGASWLTWLGYQLQPDLHLPWYIRNSENFPFAAWQVLFMTGLVIGFRGPALTRWLERRPALRTALIGLAVVVAIGVASSSAIFGDSAPGLFDKVAQRPVRLAGFAAAALMLYTAVTLAWLPVRRATGWLLLPLGQHALYCYTLHLFVILFIINAVRGAPIAGPMWWSSVMSGTTLQIGLVLAMWVLVRRRILFRVVPR
jgi:hypothetical protein